MGRVNQDEKHTTYETGEGNSHDVQQHHTEYWRGEGGASKINSGGRCTMGNECEKNRIPFLLRENERTGLQSVARRGRMGWK